MLARQDFAAVDSQTAQTQSTPRRVVKAVSQTLPPVPTVEALMAYASPGTGSAPPETDLSSVPVVIVPQPQSPQVVQAPASQPPAAAAPVPRTRSSR